MFSHANNASAFEPVTSPPISNEGLPTSVDEKLSDAGANLFLKFERRVENLNKELRSFTIAARQLEDSIGSLSSAIKLRERLSKILFLFRENAASLYPRELVRQPHERLLDPNIVDQRRRTNWRSHPPPPIAKLILEDNLEPDALPAQLESFSMDVVTFLNCLNEFPEFNDEAVNQSMRNFEGDLKYWGSCLAEYKNQFRSPAVQRYVHDLTMDIGDHIDNVTRTLSMFIGIGIPTIRFHQQHAASNVLNLSTAATLFSAVTATTLQFSYSATGSVLSDFVNALWFSSLVFSIAVIVNSLLGLAWKQAMYRSPEHRIPWWVLVWIKRSPLVFLVMSIACFSAGLLLFTYSSGQGPVTSTIVTVLTAVTSFGVAAVSAWFASERWLFVRDKCQTWLGGVISEVTDCMCAPVRASRTALHWCRMQLVVAQGYLRRLTDRMTTARTPTELLPRTQVQPQPLSRPPVSLQPHFYPQDTTSATPTHNAVLSVFSVTAEHPVSSEGHSEESADSRHSDARQRFVNAIRSVIMLQSTPRPMSLRRDSSFDTSLADRSGMLSGRLTDPGMPALRGARVRNAMSKLKALDVSQDMGAHQALVLHLQFSPNGRYLATSSRDWTSAIFRVEESFTTHRILVHVRGFIGQVACQIPLANDVRDIAVSRKTPAVLISPEKAAPQLWKLEIVRDRNRSEYALTSRLSFKHTFVLKFPVDIAGPCHFGGKDDQFVLCAAKTGDIHIWDRETATFLHHIRPQNTPGVGDLTCIGWNCATDDPMMFATGSHDGVVRIYSTPPPDSQSENSSYLERRREDERATNFSFPSGG
ncbi:hypothetical protein BS17DRAFT_810896 [Gyrodon lividus]|nr:hypothetical protein BS17DRAFT_810896 [Gyrodon lividus]